MNRASARIARAAGSNRVMCTIESPSATARSSQTKARQPRAGKGRVDFERTMGRGANGRQRVEGSRVPIARKHRPRFGERRVRCD
jgi:hypothetical protein